MMVQPEIIETVLQENGINRAQAKSIVEQVKKAALDREADLSHYLNKLYVAAIEKGIKPCANGTLSEQQAVQILNKSKSFFRVARNQKRLTPRCVQIGIEYRYTLRDLAEYLAKRDSYKPL
ncbi:hypothetical protein [Acinetobacter towneri]|uniref:hypothetical protein n=1 Tax=Acinetobacter towneri TaxID=202956 RepID=UPI0032138CCE